MNKKTLSILILLCFFGFIIRVWKLGSFPPSLNWDEASWGYNAYSILKTGRDEYGSFMPLIFKAFGDYKSALLVYLTVPSIAIFGLTEFAVRFPSVVFGVLNVFLIFFLVKELFKDFFDKEKIALLASLVMAFSPWQIHFSRGAWEFNILLFILMMAILLLLQVDKANIKKLYSSAFAFGLCFYVYTSAKLLIPLIIFGLIVFNFSEIKILKIKNIVLSLLIISLMVFPIFIYTFWGGAGGRLKIMSVFSYPMSASEEKTIKSEESGNFEIQEFNLFHNDFVYYGRGILGRYLNHFSPKFLFFEGDWTNLRHGVLTFGQMNHLDILLLPMGIYFLITRKIRKKLFIGYLLFIMPLPSVLTRDIIQAGRSFFMVLPLVIISSCGIYLLFHFFNKLKAIRIPVIICVTCLYFFSFLFYLDQFFVHAPIQHSEFWLYGYKQAVEYTKSIKDNYNRVIFTSKYGQPYIYWLFYTKYDPGIYQQQAHLIEDQNGDVGSVEKIDKIEFRPLYWPSDRYLKKTLFIGATYEIPSGDVIPNEARILKTINFLNSNPAFIIAETLE